MPDSLRLALNQVVALRTNHSPNRCLGHAPRAVSVMAVDSTDAQRATAFVVRPGLAGQGISLEALYRPGHFLRHADARLKLAERDGSPRFAQDASFIQREGLDGTGFSLESVNIPGAFVTQDRTRFELTAREACVPAKASFVFDPAPVPLPGQGRAGTVRRFALILGADEYFDARLENLEGSRNDVIDAVVTLVDKGLVAPEDLVPVASPTVSQSELAARMQSWCADQCLTTNPFAMIHSHNMRPCFLRWAAHDLKRKMDRARAAGETPMLFLFWSGHGGLVGKDRLAFRLPGYRFEGEQDEIRAIPGLPAAIRALPPAEFDRIDITYDELIDMLGMRQDESVFAVIGSCHAGAVLEGVAGEGRPADMIFTAGGIDTTLRERYLGGRWRGLLNWAVLRVLEQFEVHEDGTLSAGMDLSFGQLLQTIRSMVLALQGNTATAWLPQVHGALKDRPALLGHRVGQVFSANAGATSSQATRLGDGIEWPPGTTGYDVLIGTTAIGTICVTSTGELRMDAAVQAALFASSPATLDFQARSTAPSPLGDKQFTSSDLSAPTTHGGSTIGCFKVTKGGALVGYVLPDTEGNLGWYVLDNTAYLQTVNSKVYLKTEIDLVLTPTSALPSGTYRVATDKPL